jgi:hypothetical protein
MKAPEKSGEISATGDYNAWFSLLRAKPALFYGFGGRAEAAPTQSLILEISCAFLAC